MANTLVSLADFLKERRLMQKYSGPPSTQARQRLEQSQLLKSMREICAEINGEAGTVIVDEHQYLAPEPVVSSFTFTRGQTEYVMRLELWGPRPSLLFVTRKWRDSAQNKLSRWFYRLVQVEPVSVNLKFTCEIQSEHPSEEEVKRCFFYLLSGWSRSYLPSFKPHKAATTEGGTE
jgi:hypothetical protein